MIEEGFPIGNDTSARRADKPGLPDVWGRDRRGANSIPVTAAVVNASIFLDRYTCPKSIARSRGTKSSL